MMFIFLNIQNQIKKGKQKNDKDETEVKKKKCLIIINFFGVIIYFHMCPIDVVFLYFEMLFI